jgi:hypothetical protein
VGDDARQGGLEFRPALRYYAGDGMRLSQGVAAAGRRRSDS